MRGSFIDINENSSGFAMRLRDGVIYEDNFNSDDGLLFSNANARNAEDIRGNIGSLINFGGTGSNNIGSSDIDFTYIMYAQSSASEDVRSAYVYAGNYGLTNQNSSTFDSSKLQIVGLAEIVGGADGSLTSSSILRNKGTLGDNERK